MTEPLATLRAELKILHRHNGEPSIRDIAGRTDGAISRTTVSRILNCAKCPRWKQLEAVVTALDGDVGRFLAMWIAVRDFEDPAPPSPPRSRANHGRAFVEELARTFAEEAAAFMLLDDAGYPMRHVPTWADQPGAIAFWRAVVTNLERGFSPEGGPEVLAEAAFSQYPRNRIFRVAASQSLSTLLFTGSERYPDIRRLVRDRLGPGPRLLYAAATQIAFDVPDGDRAEAAVAELATEARRIDPEADIQVVLQENDHQPYLIRALTVAGPDGQVFVVEEIPSTTPIRDILHAFLGFHTAEDRADRFGPDRRLTVGRELPGEPSLMIPLDPERTLHESGVEDGDRLLVRVDPVVDGEPGAVRSGGGRDRQ